MHLRLSLSLSLVSVAFLRRRDQIHPGFSDGYDDPPQQRPGEPRGGDRTRVSNQSRILNTAERRYGRDRADKQFS